MAGPSVSHDGETGAVKNQIHEGRVGGPQRRRSRRQEARPAIWFTANAVNATAIRILTLPQLSDLTSRAAPGIGGHLHPAQRPASELVADRALPCWTPIPRVDTRRRCSNRSGQRRALLTMLARADATGSARHRLASAPEVVPRRQVATTPPTSGASSSGRFQTPDPATAVIRIIEDQLRRRRTGRSVPEDIQLGNEEQRGS